MHGTADLMDTSIYTFVEDLRGEGIPEVLGRVIDEYGCSGMTVAAAYHRARDVTPHGSSRVTLRPDGVHFVPGPEFEGVRLSPTVRHEASREPLMQLRRLTAERRVTLHGWAVFCHAMTVGLQNPEVTQRSCFGDLAAPADLCPSHPDVREYADALARSIAARGVDTVVAEALHFGSFGHGYHHERSFVDLGPVEDFCLGLCFCEHCRAGFAGDAEAARCSAAGLVSRAMDGHPPVFTGDEVTVDALAAAGGPELAAYATSRSAAVTSLAADVADAVRQEGSRLVFLDGSGAMKGYADGRPTGGPAVESAWRLGVDPAGIGAVVDGYAALVYAHDVDRVAADVAAYRAALGERVTLRAVLRPGAPDTDSGEHLRAKVRAARDAGADAIDFYNYGMYPLSVLDRIPVALR